MPLRGWVICVSVLMVASGCATLLQPDQQQVTVQSEPAGATIYLDDERRGSTPMALALHPRGTYRLRVEYPGYQSYEGLIPHQTAFPMWGPLAYPAQTLTSPISITLRPQSQAAR
jgi:uncharacterized protein YceK